MGGFVGAGTSDLVISLSFAQILDGKAVKYTREAKAANFAGVTHFYWSPDRGEVCFLSLNSRGIVGEGVVMSEGGGIVLRGNSHWPDRTVEFETILRIGPKGTLTDTFKRKENGEWVVGHVQEFVVKE